MQKHVVRLLHKPTRAKKMMSISLDEENAELVEKLSLFFSHHTHQSVSRNQVVEEAVKAFIDDSADYIAEEYGFQIRDVALSDLQAHTGGTTVDVCVLDTVVIPVKDTGENRDMLLRSGTTPPVQLDQDKLKCTRYLAFYLGSPTSAITHYARIQGHAPAEGASNKQILRYDAPEELAHRIEWGDPSGKWLRRPRYTVYKMLLEAKMIEELF